jgi:hypothetical protein
MAAKDNPQVGNFPSTRWSLVCLARAGDCLKRREALDELLRLYLPALRAYLLYRRRIEPDRAEDLLQGFIVRQVLERELLARADANRGRFRSFLLKSLQNYVFSELASPGPEEVALDLDLPGNAVHEVFELEWARQLLQETLRRMKQECLRDGQVARWELFACRVVLPTLIGSQPPTYQALVERFGFRSPEQASNALVTAKRHFERTIRTVIAEMENASGDEEIDAEIADLCGTLARVGPLGMDWDRGLIAGPQGQARESFAAVEESRPSDMACMLSVRGTSKGNWQPAELRDLLRHCLEMPVSEYLAAPAEMPGSLPEFSADSPSERAVVSITLGELLQLAEPLGLLIAVKRHARELARARDGGTLTELHTLVYFASIAAAMVRHGERITKSSPEVLRVAFARHAAAEWVDDRLRAIFLGGLQEASG